MLNNIGLPGIILIAVVVLVLFGRGKVSSLMGEVGKGITAFKKGVKDGAEEVERESEDLRSVENSQVANDAQRARDAADTALRDVTPPDSKNL